MIAATTKDGFEPQLERFFHEFPAKTKDMPAPTLDPKTTLYDALETIDEIVETLFEHLDRLYLGAGARNFVLLDVPSLDRSPGALDQEEISSEIRESCKEWNEAMKSGIRDFSKISKEANMRLFSSERFLSNILDSPEDYGFDEADTCLENGAIWADELHLATEVHRLLAKELIQALDTELRNAA
ncbi:hypothetical protein FRC17_003379 [Serendipita sp. 399]|nr:hypothetical protein FRC17_003379 [Serendipita sp. 399]